MTETINECFDIEIHLKWKENFMFMAIALTSITEREKKHVTYVICNRTYHFGVVYPWDHFVSSNSLHNLPTSLYLFIARSSRNLWQKRETIKTEINASHNRMQYFCIRIVERLLSNVENMQQTDEKKWLTRISFLSISIEISMRELFVIFMAWTWFEMKKSCNENFVLHITSIVNSECFSFFCCVLLFFLFRIWPSLCECEWLIDCCGYYTTTTLLLAKRTLWYGSFGSVKFLFW